MCHVRDSMFRKARESRNETICRCLASFKQSESILCGAQAMVRLRMLVFEFFRVSCATDASSAPSTATTRAHAQRQKETNQHTGHIVQSICHSCWRRPNAKTYPLRVDSAKRATTSPVRFHEEVHFRSDTICFGVSRTVRSSSQRFPPWT